MAHSEGRHTVGLSVVPKLLSDTLERALVARGLDVVVLRRGVAVDCAVVDASGPRWIRARVVVRLPAPDDACLGSVTAGGHRQQVLLDSLTAVLAVIDAHR
jgi:hypothetical protein